MEGTEGLREVEVGVAPLERFEPVIAPEQYRLLMAAAARAIDTLGGRTVWNVNSTAYGGGVAEMLHSLVGYIRGVGLDARWLVIPGSAEFFQVTKRVHNHLQSAGGDGGVLDEDARRTYEGWLDPVAGELISRVRRGDIVLLHDPQTAGLVPALAEAGAHTIWRCHVGVDFAGGLARDAWRFLLPYVRPAEAYVFSRAAFAWEGLDPLRTWVIPPSIDVFSPKNREMDSSQVRSLLGAAGIVVAELEGPASFTRQDGSSGRVERRAHMFETRPLTGADRVVLQVSRWDELKDPVGVIVGFARHVAPESTAHLVLAGPDVSAVADDPEGNQVLLRSIAAWEALPATIRDQVHLAVLPMADSDENASLVNALQRQAEVVVQKSLAEGFGLTVAEAMWKAKPTVASRVGG
ncbi:MAG: glycosyltransferase, partial [Candidatus Dormibacteraeota bacterium]|nr:glycosyltransferase [Candidatus Dormibacteraeota bacterium]